MAPLPPPQTPASGGPPPDRARPRRRLVVALAAAGTALAVGGVVLAGTLVSAKSSASAPEASSAQALPAVVDDTGSGLPEELDELIAGAEEFVTCMAEELGGVVDGLPIDPDDTAGTVIVGTPGEDGSLTILDFGEGDGTITIDKSGDEVTVETDGDVSVFDASDLEDLLSEGADSLSTALEACEGSLPELPALPDLGDLAGTVDELIDELPLDELIDGLPLEELGDLDLDQILDELIDGLSGEPAN